MEKNQFDDAKALVRDLLRMIGEDPDRDGLKETPARVVRSWTEIYSGYTSGISHLNRVFEQKCDQMIVLRGIEFYSMCEHHMLPFFGTCHVAYLPEDNRVLGLSKLARMVEVYSRRLQLQERLTCQIAEGIHELVHPKGVAVYMDGQHLCMMMRGVRQQNATMRTSELRGIFLEDSKARSEALEIMRIDR